MLGLCDNHKLYHITYNHNDISLQLIYQSIAIDNIIHC